MKNLVRRLLFALTFTAHALAQTPKILNVGPILTAGTKNVQMLVAGQNFGINGTVLVNGVAEKTTTVNAYGVYALLPVVPSSFSVRFRTQGGQLSAEFPVTALPPQTITFDPTKPVGSPALPPTAPAKPPAPPTPIAPVTPPTTPVTTPPPPPCVFGGTCWYIRADGGTPAQCDGKTDAAFPGGALTGQHCAFGDYRYLYDQHVYGQLKWVIAGGDTVILDSTKQWRVGFDQGQSPNDVWCLGDSGNNGCMNPTLPSGTAAQPTRLLGRNYANCAANSAKTQLFGGYGVWVALNLAGAQFVDVQCLEITTHGNCIVHGSPNPNPCSTSYPVSDYDSDGIGTDVNTHDVLLQDLWIHGHTDRGIKGPIGGLITANRVNIDTNGMAGWDLDPGDGTPSPNGALKLSYVTIQFSGCDQEYPFVHAVPVQACYSQSTGGYGDGIGTPVTNMVSVSIDHSVFRYNTQDGEDFGHILLANQLSLTDSLSYANNGGQFKWAGFQNVVFENNIAVADCLRMSQPLPGAPAGYNANLADFCRANDALSFDFNNNANALLANNTIISYAPVTFDIQCYDSKSCAGTTLTLENNIVRGYDNPTTWNMGGQQGGVGLYCLNGCNGSSLPLGNIVRQNNIYYGVRGGCQAQGTEQCSDPLFTNEPAAFISEATLDGYSFGLSSGSPAEYHGLPVNGLSSDYLGTSFQSPSIGALAYGSGVVLPQP